MPLPLRTAKIQKGKDQCCFCASWRVNTINIKGIGLSCKPCATSRGYDSTGKRIAPKGNQVVQ